MKAIIETCECKHSAQDQIYGAGKRLKNPTTKSKTVGKTIYRCTVCGKENG